MYMMNHRADLMYIFQNHDFLAVCLENLFSVIFWDWTSWNIIYKWWC